MSIEPLPFHVETVGPFAGIGVVRLEQPGKPVVVLDHPLIQRLEATLAAMSKDLRGLVVASGSSRVFVAGADLKTISEWNDEQLHAYLAYGSRVFGMISALPCPTAAAINGAALGGGLELAMHCDGLIASPPAMKDGQPGKPYPVGLPEAGLGLCPGWGGTNLLPARMDPARAIAITASGTPMMFDQARDAGLFDAVSDSPENLIATAMTWIASMTGKRWERDGAPSRWIGRSGISAKVMDAVGRVKVEVTPTGPSAAVLAAVDAGLTKGWRAALESEQRDLVRLRHSPEAKAALEAFFAKSTPSGAPSTDRR